MNIETLKMILEAMKGLDVASLDLIRSTAFKQRMKLEEDLKKLVA